MNLKQFISKTGLFSKTELERVYLLAYFFRQREGFNNFSTKDVNYWFQHVGLPSPNLSRLRSNLIKSKYFVRVMNKNFSLHPREITELESQYPELSKKSEEVVALDTILPSSLYSNTRGFIESLSEQINASYERNIFDGCAVLMRRLIEVLLILTYQHLNIDDQIKNLSGSYKPLHDIISDAKSNRTINLSNPTKMCIDKFRVLGNFAGHRIFYNTKRGDIDRVALDFRASIEELLYKAGVKT